MNAKLTRGDSNGSRSHVKARRAGDDGPSVPLDGVRLYRALSRQRVLLPWPRVAVLREEEVLTRRDLHCPCYAVCLDMAVVCGWASWTCDNCPAFERPARSRADRVLP